MTAVPPTLTSYSAEHNTVFQPLKGNDGRAAEIPLPDPLPPI